MSKALLRQYAEQAIKERDEQEQAFVKKAQASQQQAPTPATVHTQTAQPVTVIQTLVLPDTKAIAEAAKSKQQAEQVRLENERLTHAREELARENEALKIKHESVLREIQIKAVQEQARADIEEQALQEQLANNVELVRRVSQENDLLKEELARLKLENNEKKVSNDVLSQVLDVEETVQAENLVAAPPVYDEGNAVVVSNNDAVNDDVAVIGDVVSHGKVDDNCSVS